MFTACYANVARGYIPRVKVTVLTGHYDGEKICLHEPCDLAPGTPLLITILPDDAFQREREEWLAASQAALARAYGEDEPDYSDYIGRLPPAE